ncbi:DUF2187 family protein [Cytobacillus oceanisediminis]|uniref:Uncharacterized protein YkvS n=1 Tax=Cytobacillus oceanisediminis TaxID=665099 RepID=A0A562K6U5_9BACI|nr:DUF2187 family protein [Cytobacillus oceanisediminis]TWH91142.1 uncharacterized protein YkvS [Cytobacillus oceanisediminis]
MAEETEKASDVKKADIGDTISITSGTEKGKKGKVVVVRDNSVIVELGINPKKDEPIKTVISHKRYKVVK